MTTGLEPAGLVLGHRVYVARVPGIFGPGQAHWGRVTGLGDGVEVRLERAGWSAEYHAGVRVRAMHPGREAVECRVLDSAHGVLRLRIFTESS